MNCAERGQINIAKVTCSQIFVNVNETKRLLQSAFWGIVCTIRREGSCLAHRAPSFVASDRQNVEQFVHLDAFDEKFCVVWAAARRKGSLGRGDTLRTPVDFECQLVFNNISVPLAIVVVPSQDTVNADGQLSWSSLFHQLQSDTYCDPRNLNYRIDNK